MALTMKKAKKPSVRADRALFDASKNGDVACVRERIAAGANINGCTKEQYPPLCIAAAFGQLETVRTLIAAGADLNQVAQVRWENFPSSPLVSAIKNGHIDVAQELVSAGAKVELETHPGHNAVTDAAFQAIGCNWMARGGAGELARIAKLGSRAQNRRAELGWMKFVRDALEKGVHIQDYCLWEAAKLGAEEMALLLIEHGVDPNVAPHRSTVLEKALGNGLTNVAVALLKAGADANKRQGSAPPLLVSVARGDFKVVHALLDAGADINATGDILIAESDVPAFQEEADGSVAFNISGILSDPKFAQASSALIVAVRRGDHEMVKLLLERGANVDLGDKSGKTPVAWAIDLGWHQIIRTLREFKSAEPEFLEGSASRALLTAAENGDETETKNLLARSASPNSPVDELKSRRFPIHAAAENGHNEIAKLLLQAGADVNAPGRVEFTVGVTPLMLVAEAGHVELVRTLLKAGAYIHAKTRELEGGKETALHYAARGGSVGAIQLLIEAGAKVNATASGQVTPLMYAVIARHFEAAQVLIASGAVANSGPSDGSGALWHAAHAGDLQMVRLLLANGASPIPRGGKPFAFPLDAAASNGSIEVLRMLIEAGAPVNAMPVHGGSALASATVFGHEHVVEALLTAGADPNLSSNDGMTSVMLAVRLGRERILDRLLAAGGELNRRNAEGKTCLDIAHHSGRRSMVARVKAGGGKYGNEL